MSAPIDLWVGPAANIEDEGQNAVDVGIGVVSKEAFDLETLPDMDATGDYPQQGWAYVATKQAMLVVLLRFPISSR